MAGLLEEIARRAQMLPPALAFPDYVPQAPAEEAAPGWLDSLPQTLLPPHLRKQPRAVDASSPAIQMALGNAGMMNVPPQYAVHTGAGSLPPGVGGQGAGMPMMEPLDTAAPPPAPSIPVPRARPPEADAIAEAPPTSTDVSARARPAGAPLQLAPQLDAISRPAAPVQPDVGMFGGGSILDRIRTTLGDNSNTLLALGAGFAGAPNIGQGISRAAAAAIPARAADINQTLARQTRGVTTKALIDAGVPVQQAIAASGDPELKKALIKNYIEDRAGKIVEVGMDRNGRKIMAQYDPFTKQLTPIDVDKLTGQSASAAADADLTGPDYLASLKEKDPQYARKIEAIVNGDAPFPTGRSALTPLGDRMIKDVLQVEPGATPTDFANRQATSKSYSSGVDSRITKSVNTTLKHAGTLEKAINDLDNFNVLPGVMNPVRGAIAGQTSPAYQRARAAYQTAVANFAKELDFVVSGGRPTVSGSKHQMEGFDPNASKEAQMEKLRTGIDLLKGRLDSHAEGFAKGMKRRVDPTDFIDSPNRALYQRLIGGEAPATAAPAATPAVAAPKPGRYVFDPATMSLVPAK